MELKCKHHNRVRNASIFKLSRLHPNMSQVALGRVFHISKQRVHAILNSSTTVQRLKKIEEGDQYL